MSESTEVLVASSELNKQHGGSVPSESIIRKRLRKFKRLKRGYWSFVAILIAYVVSFFLPMLANNNAIIVKYEDELYFPLLEVYQATQFGQSAIGEANYRALREQFTLEESSDWVFMPPYPYGPNESLLDESGFPPHPPTKQHLFGTDDRGRDVFIRLAYGFHISVTFALLVTFISYALGIVVGATLGYLGGKVDLLGQRTIEIWSSLPFLYTVIIVSSIIVPVYLPGRNQLLQPAFWLLAIILSAFGWMGITHHHAYESVIRVFNPPDPDALVKRGLGCRIRGARRERCPFRKPKRGGVTSRRISPGKFTINLIRGDLHKTPYPMGAGSG